MIINNKILSENTVFTTLNQKLLAARIYINKKVTKGQPRFRSRVEAN